MDKESTKKLVKMAYEIEEQIKPEKIQQARSRIELENYRVTLSAKLNRMIGFIMAFESKDENTA